MSDMAIEIKRRSFTVTEYHRLFDEGFLTERDRVELIDGDLIEMPPIGRFHVSRHARITRYLNDALRGRATVLPMGSFPLGERSEPQPDLAVFPFDDQSYEKRPYPPVTEFLAFIEIADFTLAYDLKIKMRLYASHGVCDYLLVDLRGNRVLVHRKPTPTGYTSTFVLTYGERFALSQIADVQLSANEFLAVP